MEELLYCYIAILLKEKLGNWEIGNYYLVILLTCYSLSEVSEANEVEGFCFGLRSSSGTKYYSIVILLIVEREIRKLKIGYWKLLNG